jgi:hypothetical protein
VVQRAQRVLVFLALLGLSTTLGAELPSKAQPKEALEIQKLAAEVSKAELESKYFYLGYIAPAVAVISGMAAITAIFLQRRTTFRVQRETERANLELKAAEFILNSPTPYIGKQKLDLVRLCYAHLLSEDFLLATADIDLTQLPGTRLYEMKLECFKQLSAKSNSVEEVVAAALAVFPADEGRIIEKSDRLRLSSGNQATSQN